MSINANNNNVIAPPTRNFAGGIITENNGTVLVGAETHVKYYGDGSALDLGYMVYQASLSQAGTSAPTAVVFQNTVNFAVTLSRVTTGTYKISGPNGTNAFPANKTFVLVGGLNDSFYHASIVVGFGTGMPITILTPNDDATDLADGLLNNTALEIRIYP